MTDEERKELSRLQWAERQVAGQVKDWLANAGSEPPGGYVSALHDCAQEITDILAASYEPGYGLAPEDHAAELRRHADALVAEVELLRAAAAC